MPIKISFMHYMKWAVVMLPIVFEEFEVVYIFFATFFLLLSLSVYKRSTLAKILGGEGGLQLPQFPRFLRAWFSMQI